MKIENKKMVFLMIALEFILAGCKGGNAVLLLGIFAYIVTKNKKGANCTVTALGLACVTPVLTYIKTQWGTKIFNAGFEEAVNIFYKVIEVSNIATFLLGVFLGSYYCIKAFLPEKPTE